MDDHFDGRFPGLFAAVHESAHPSPSQSPYPATEPAAVGGAVRRGVHGRRETGADGPGHGTVTAMPDPRPEPRPDPRPDLGPDPRPNRGPDLGPGLMPEPPRSGPRRSALARTFCLEPALSSVPVARRVVAGLLAEWGTPIDVDTAILLTSELVANAVTHGGVPGKPVLLAVFDLGGRLHVEVHDPGGRGAGGVECKRPTLDGESGRGLAIVAALADFWDWEPTGWGKVVYFGLSAASEARAA